MSVVATLMKLLDRSLVVREERDGQTRYRLLESVRAFAWERTSDDERATIRDRHLDHFIDVAEQVSAHVNEPDAAAWLRRGADESDNFLAALAAPAGSDGRALTLATNLTLFWNAVGSFELGRSQLTAALDRSGDVDPARRAEAQHHLGVFLGRTGDIRAKIAADTEALALYRQVGDHQRALATAVNLAAAYNDDGDLIRAHQMLADHAEELQGAEPMWRGVAEMLHGVIHEARGEIETAISHTERSCELFRRAGARMQLGTALANLGELVGHLGELDEARRLFGEAEQIALDRGDRWRYAGVIEKRSLIEAKVGAIDVAREGMTKALAIFEETGAGRDARMTLLRLASLEREPGPELEALLRRALERARGANDRQVVALAGAWLSTLSRPTVAGELLAEAVAASEGVQKVQGTLYGAIAHLLARRRRWDEAVMLAEHAHPVVDFAGPCTVTALMERALEPVRDALGERYDELARRGREMSHEHAHRFAVDVLANSTTEAM